MDIVTHAGIGIILAAPLIADQPLLAMGLMFGSVAPDLDSFSRVFGKRAFLAMHQTYTHGIPLLLGTCALAAVAGLSVSLCLGFAVGATLHVLLDYSNTLGVALAAPISRKRFKLDWVFLIDLPVIVATVFCAFGAVYGMGHLDPPRAWLLFCAYCAFMLGYWPFKGWLHRRALLRAPAGTVSLIPSAALPWRFLGFLRENSAGRNFILNIWTRQVLLQPPFELPDEAQFPAVTNLPEFQEMRRLSPCYYIISQDRDSDGVEVICRDLRIRNFNTTFGDLRVSLNANGNRLRHKFHV